jgi:voltage-gated potassium channel
MKWLNQLVINIAYKINDSDRYHKIKNYVYNLLENPNSKHKKYFDFIMITLIIMSISIMIIEVDHVVPSFIKAFDLVVVTSLFLVEYLMRFWIHDSVHKVIIKYHEDSKFLGKQFRLREVVKTVAKKKWDYVSSFAAIIDLLAILPSYRPLRVLRIFVLFRIFKLLRHAKDLNGFFEILAVKKFEFFTLFILLMFFLLVSSVLIYVYEGGGVNPKIGNYFDAIYWAMVTMSTVGYGDITPVTNEGKMVSIFIILVGIGIVSFATSIVVSAFDEKLHQIKQNRVINHISQFETYVLILGYSPTASIVAKWLRQHHQDFLIVESDEQKLQDAYDNNYSVLLGDATSQDVYSKAPLEHKITNILCLADDDVTNISMVLTVRSLNQGVHIIAKANKKHNINKLKFIGANVVFDGYAMVGNIAREYIGAQSAFESIYEILSDHGGLIDEFRVHHDSHYVGESIEAMKLESYHLILLGIKRHNESGFYFNPESDFVLHKNDVLVLMGDERAINYFKINAIKNEVKQ